MSNFPQTDRKPFEIEYGTTDKSMFNFFNAVYAWLAVGLALTGAVAFGIAQSPAAMKFLHGNGSFVTLLAAVGLLIISFTAQTMIQRVQPAIGTAIFLLYSALMGVLMSWIFIVYKLHTIGGAFAVTAGIFGVMSVYGYVTKRDLTSIGTLCVMGLMGLIVASLVNIFIASSALDWIITYGVLLVTLGIIAYRTQFLREMALQYEGNPNMLARIAIFGSLVLYISFINLFISVLRIMGNRR